MEERIVNDATGGEKCRKEQRFELLPWEQLAMVAELYAQGAKKYSDQNWTQGYDWSLSFGALHRHLQAWWCGETNDEETRCNHLSSVVFHALALMYFEKYHPGLDDRHTYQREPNFSGRWDENADEQCEGLPSATQM